MEDIDPDFEPQSRPRSCTWPLRRPDFLEKPTAGAAAATTEQGTPAAVQQDQTQENTITPQVPETPDVKQDLTAAGTRKNCSRRNAWGNLSYADLITKAISGAPDQRLTLSQIYDWMVKNVPFFKDKGDSNSSAGWKVSLSFLTTYPLLKPTYLFKYKYLLHDNTPLSVKHLAKRV